MNIDAMEARASDDACAAAILPVLTSAAELVIVLTIVIETVTSTSLCSSGDSMEQAAIPSREAATSVVKDLMIAALIVESVLFRDSPGVLILI